MGENTSSRRTVPFPSMRMVSPSPLAPLKSAAGFSGLTSWETGLKNHPSFFGVTLTIPFNPAALHEPSSAVVVLDVMPAPSRVISTSAIPISKASNTNPEAAYSCCEAAKLAALFAFVTSRLPGAKDHPAFVGVIVTFPFRPWTLQVPSSAVSASREILAPSKTSFTPPRPRPVPSTMIPETLYSLLPPPKQPTTNKLNTNANTPRR